MKNPNPKTTGHRCRRAGAIRKSVAIVGAAVLLALPKLLPAQSYSIDWSSIGGGGGPSTGGVYSVSGTLGQPDAGTMSGDNYSLAGGFWSLISIVEMPGAPRLTIVNAGTNTVKVCWPDPSTGWVLQQNNDLNTTNWVTNSLPVVVEGTNRCVTVSPPVGSLFFRLGKP